MKRELERAIDELSIMKEILAEAESNDSRSRFYLDEDETQELEDYCDSIAQRLREIALAIK